MDDVTETMSILYKIYALYSCVCCPLQQVDWSSVILSISTEASTNMRWYLSSHLTSAKKLISVCRTIPLTVIHFFLFQRCGSLKQGTGRCSDRILDCPERTDIFLKYESRACSLLAFNVYILYIDRAIGVEEIKFRIYFPYMWFQILTKSICSFLSINVHTKLSILMYRIIGSFCFIFFTWYASESFSTLWLNSVYRRGFRTEKIVLTPS